MSEDFELQPLHSICEGARVSIRRGNQTLEGIVLGKISARTRISYIVSFLKPQEVKKIPQQEAMGFIENIPLEELLSHDDEYIRDWFAGLTRGDYTREHLAAWFLEAEEEQKQDKQMSAEQLEMMQQLMNQQLVQMPKQKKSYSAVGDLSLAQQYAQETVKRIESNFGGSLMNPTNSDGS